MVGGGLGIVRHVGVLIVGGVVSMCEIGEDDDADEDEETTYIGGAAWMACEWRSNGEEGGGNRTC
jgi:hypothetical protein